MSRTILAATFGAFLLALFCDSLLAKPPAKLNIVLFLVDDMGWQDTSVPFHTEATPLNKRYHTPNMERLAADGMKFSQAYACSLCSPSRVSLMTGMNAARHRVTNWTLRKNGLKGMPAIWASMIESMDKSLGDIRAKLEELGVAENTIVLFMSDNGSPKNSPANHPLRGHKLTAYEGGIREPMIVHWPGVTKPGSICDQYLIIEDFFPTILELAGIKNYRDETGPIDGVSFTHMLRSEQRGDQQRPLFWHFPHTYDQSPFSAVRAGDWKLIYFHATGKAELYNLRDDLSETKNLVDAEAAKAEELSAILAKFLSEVDAQMPIDRRSGKPVPLPQ